MKKSIVNVLVVLFLQAACFDEEDPWPSILDITDVRNDAITIHWQMSEDNGNRTTWQRAMITVIRTSVPLSRNTVSVNLSSEARTYIFEGLSGNTTYRASVEAFDGHVSLWYGSNMATTSLASLNWLGAPTDLSLIAKTDSSLEIVWSMPETTDASTSAVIINAPVPKSSYILERLLPGTVYNITIQAGTSYGYGNMAWSVFSTLSTPEEEYILRYRTKTPNSIMLTWPPKWLPTPTAKYLIWAKTLHSTDNVDKEISMNGQGEQGKPVEFLLRNLQHGSTYNVSITTTVSNGKSRAKRTTSKYVPTLVTKTAWSVFSTLTQGEYVVGQPRLVVETDTAASIVFQPLKQLGDVAYQFRYISKDGTKPIETIAYTENELRCPQFGCGWLCALVFNLDRRPRDYSFEIRAKVDDIWNKWTPVARRPWNLLERVCSINPPTSFVENVGSITHQRLIDIPYNPTQSPVDSEPWRYLIVVDSRQSDYSAIDISKLTDRATADIDRIPYYVTGSIEAEDLKKRVEFKIGDGSVRGGYLNYPLKDSNYDPHWTLVPISQSENEIMDPNLKTCGFTQDGSFECDMTFWELASHVPLWITTSVFLLSILCLFLCCLLGFCWLRSHCGQLNGTKESNIMYYHSDSPNTVSTTSAYRRVEQREFHPREMEERIRFLSE